MGFEAIQTAPINGELTFTVKMWSLRPPTHEEIESAGGTVCALNFSRTIASDLSRNERDITFISSRDNTRAQVAPTQRKHNARLFCADWASQLYIVRATVDGERARIFTIARYRENGNLYAFTNKGIPYKHIKTRKHVKPSFVRRELNIKDGIEITVDCVQLDAIRAAQSERRAQKRVNIPDLPYARSASLRVINENEQDRKKREEREKERPTRDNEMEYGIDENIPSVDVVGFIGASDCARPVHASRPTHEDRAATLEKRRRNLETRKRAIEARRNPTKAVL